LTQEREEVRDGKEGFIKKCFISFTIHLALFGLLIWENKNEVCGMYGIDEDYTGKVGIRDRVILQ
jgi:membrane protein involved in colicin uptake